MEQVANVRLHRETSKRPCDAFKEEKPTLQPLPLAGYDISCSRRVRATNRCRIAFESNRYTVPFEHAGALLELRVEPDTVTIYRGQKLIAQHPRNYGRNQDIENPDHVSRLLQERKRAEDATLLARFLALSPRASVTYTRRCSAVCQRREYSPPRRTLYRMVSADGWRSRLSAEEVLYETE
jgi:hypothetical protein